MTDDSNDNSDLKKINNFNFDENIFNTEPTTSKKKKGKLKKNKAIDFMDYAKDKGIEINLQYEEPKQLEMPKPQNNYKKDFEKPKYENNPKIKTSNDKLKDKDKEKEKEKEKEKKENIIEEKKDNEFKDDYYKERKGKNYNQDYDFYDNSYYNQNDYYHNNNRRFFNNYNNYKDYDNYDDYNNYNDNYNRNYRSGFNHYDNYDYDYDYKNNYYRNNYYNNNYGYDNRNKNYNYENRRNNNIAIELPDPTENNNNENILNSNNNNTTFNIKNDNNNIKNKKFSSNNNNKNNNNYNNINQNNINQNIQNKNMQMPMNPKMMIPLGNNKFDKLNPKPIYPNPLLGAQMMNNYHAQMLNMNYLNPQLNVNPYIPNYTFLNRDEDILNLIESFFSKKYLNKHLDIRTLMLNDEGLVPIDYILNLIKIKGAIITQEKICEIIEKIGSDIVGKKVLDNNIFLFPKNYNDIKDSLISIEEMKKNNEQIKKQQQMFAQQQQLLFQQSQMPMPFMASMMTPMNMGMYYGPLIWPQEMNFNTRMRSGEKKDEKD